MKVAIVCDWLTGIGGAERVVLELHKLYPAAPIYTSQYDPNQIDWFKDADVRTGWLQKLPKGLRKFLPVLRAWWFSHLGLDDYDLVVSSSGAEAKGIKTGKNTLHVNYCHSPTHYYWIRYDEYMQNPGFGAFNWLARLGLKLLAAPMRRWDHKAAQRPDVMIANSSFTKANIKKYYGRDAEIIYPPVDVERFTLSTAKRSGFIAAGRQTSYKRIDLAVEACTKLDLPLNVVGNGPGHRQLAKAAGPTIKFHAKATDQEMPKYFRSAQALIFPGKEDFGITAVEAMAAGTPAIAYKAGGAIDYVVPGKTGEFFDKQTVESVAQALKSFKPEHYDHKQIQEHAKQFSTEKFRNKFATLINSVVS